MKSAFKVSVCLLVVFAGLTQAYLIQGLDLDIEYWVGDGDNECVVAVDWNNTNGPYNTPFHLFGFRWDGSQVTVKEALTAIDEAGPLDIVYGYGGGYISHMLYDQTLVDGDDHTTINYAGWWWTGQTQDGGLTWQPNNGGVDTEYIWDGGIEAFNINGTNWGPDSMSIPEPATLLIFCMGLFYVDRKKRCR